MLYHRINTYNFLKAKSFIFEKVLYNFETSVGKNLFSNYYLSGMRKQNFSISFIMSCLDYSVHFMRAVLLQAIGHIPVLRFDQS